MLKTSHSLVTGHGEIKLVLSRDALSRELAFIVLGSAEKGANGQGSHQQSYAAVRTALAG